MTDLELIRASIIRWSNLDSNGRPEGVCPLCINYLGSCGVCPVFELKSNLCKELYAEKYQQSRNKYERFRAASRIIVELRRMESNLRKLKDQ